LNLGCIASTNCPRWKNYSSGRRAGPSSSDRGNPIYAEHRRPDGIVSPEPAAEESDEHLRDQLAAANGRLYAVGLLQSQATASRRSCLFLGMLEMARDQRIEVQQDEIFGPIWMRRIAAD
jgi:chromatin segregation and condensation protein Rec8/ScpA/Scc1 (kleisin family)